MTDRLTEIEARAHSIPSLMSKPRQLGEFLAHAREDVPYLLAELRALRERLDVAAFMASENTTARMDANRRAHAAEARAERAEKALREERALAGELRRIFRHRMREWREHGADYSYGEEDVEQFLVDAAREATALASDGETG